MQRKISSKEKEEREGEDASQCIHILDYERQKEIKAKWKKDDIKKKKRGGV